MRASTGRAVRGADALHLPVLEKTQQEPLHAQAHLADFVQEQRAAIGQLELPGLVRYAPVKLPFSWPKSSDSRRVSGSPAQFNVDHGGGRAPGMLMDFLGKELLADAALAGDQDLCVGLSGATSERQGVDEFGALADDPGTGTTAMHAGSQTNNDPCSAVRLV